MSELEIKYNRGQGSLKIKDKKLGSRYCDIIIRSDNASKKTLELSDLRYSVIVTAGGETISNKTIPQVNAKMVRSDQSDLFPPYRVEWEPDMAVSILEQMENPAKQRAIMRPGHKKGDAVIKAGIISKAPKLTGLLRNSIAIKSCRDGT